MFTALSSALSSALLRPSPAGPLLQGTKLAAPSTPEASLERLVPLVDYLAAWKLLPNVSRWVLQTVEKSYCIQFCAPPLHFTGICLTLVSPEQAVVLETRSDHSLEEGGYRGGPSSRQGVSTACTSLFQRRMGCCVRF